MNDPLGDALRRAGAPRPSDDPDVLDAAQQLARSVSRSVAQPRIQPRTLRHTRPVIRLGFVVATVAVVIAVGAAVNGPAGRSAPAAPTAEMGSCVLETYVAPSGGTAVAGFETARAAAEEFIVASGRQGLALETANGHLAGGTEARDSLSGLLGEEAQVKSEEVTEAVAAAGYLPSTIALDFAVRCSEDPSQ